MGAYEIAERATEAYNSLEYPDKPIKPVKKPGMTNKEFGEILDLYESDLVSWRKRVDEYNHASFGIESTFKSELLESLNLTNHPKAEKLYYLAWCYGHSSGYVEVAMIAEELAELLR